MKKLILGFGRNRPTYSYSLALGRQNYSRRWRASIYTLAVFCAIGVAGAVALRQSDASAATTPANLASATGVSKLAAQPSLGSPTINLIPQEDAALSQIISQFAASHPDQQWSVQLTGLGGDSRAASFNANQKFNTASIYKLLLIYPLLQKAPYQTWPDVTLGVNGQLRSLSDCVAAMLRVSDNACGDAVGDYVGWAYADAQLKDIGLMSTALNSAAGPTTTAADVATYLGGLYNSSWINGDARDFVLGQMGQQIYRKGIPAGAGSAASVADKIGDLGFVRHDAGIVSYRGGTYVLSIFTSGASYAQIAQLSSLIQAALVQNI